MGTCCEEVWLASCDGAEEWLRFVPSLQVSPIPSTATITRGFHMKMGQEVWLMKGGLISLAAQVGDAVTGGQSFL